MNASICVGCGPRSCGFHCLQVGKALTALARACWSAGDAAAADAALDRLSGVLDGLCDDWSPRPEAGLAGRARVGAAPVEGDLTVPAANPTVPTAAALVQEHS